MNAGLQPASTPVARPDARPAARPDAAGFAAAVPPRLSAVVIVQNEAHRIDACLQSLGEVADEIVIVDGGSSDDTVVRCRAYTDRIFHRPFDWAARQMNFGLEQARGDWALIVDADERLTPRLREAIHAVVSAATPGAIAGYSFARRNFVFGRWLRHGGNYPDYNSPRLFRRGRGWFEDEPVHARLLLDGGHGILDGDLLHETYPDLASYFAKFNAYTTFEADRLLRRGVPFSWTRMLAHAGGHLLERLIVKAGVRDGAPGVVYAGLGFAYDCVRYLKLRELEQSGSAVADDCGRLPRAARHDLVPAPEVEHAHRP